MWDASLDPGGIRTQVKSSLGLTEAAFRGTRPNINDGEDHQIGHRHARYGGPCAVSYGPTGARGDVAGRGRGDEQRVIGF
jgi:hypothetical protein